MATKSVKYTRRHFVDTAEMIKSMPKPQRAKWAMGWAIKYAEDNPRFDRAKFMKACGV
jgi:hypothetical protein